MDTYIYKIHVTVYKKQTNIQRIPRIHLYKISFRIQVANIVGFKSVIQVKEKKTNIHGTPRIQ